MITGILLISLVTFMAVVSYKRPGLEQKVIKQIPVIDWLLIFVFPIIFYFGIVMIVKSILQRERVEVLDFEDMSLIGIGIIFLIYSFVGISVHFVSKVLSRFIKKENNSKIYQINEIFHGKLSHYVAFACAYMVVFILALLELNYPMFNRLPNFYLVLISISGILAGYSSFKAIFYTNAWYGGYSKPFFLITLVFIVILKTIYRSHELTMGYYPMNVFISSVLITIVCIYTFRQLLIFSKLSKKRRMMFISRILSV